MPNKKNAIANIYYDLFEFMTIYNHRIWCNVNLSLPLNHLGVLFVLEQYEKATGSELTKKLAISKQQLSVILHKLSKEGLICKATHNKDRRYVEFSLTREGVEFIKKHRQDMREHFLHFAREVENVDPVKFADSVENVKQVVKALIPAGKGEL